MSETSAGRLEALVREIKALPHAAQDALVEEFLERLSDFADGSLPNMTPKQPIAS